MSQTILRTKLCVPPERPQLVARLRLTDSLLAGFAGKLSVISAAAGSGKTTLVSDLVRQIERPVAWLSLDGGDNDPMRFLAYLVAAFRESCRESAAGIGDATASLLQSPQPPALETMMATLLNEIAAAENALILVLDDYHVINNRAIHEAVAFFIEHLPAGAHLIIASRTSPPLPLPRLRGRGELTELRMPDLRFTTDEAATFFGLTMKLELTPENVAALTARTEGWIAGLQLAALSLHRRRDSGQFIKDFTGRHQYVLEYLVDEVVSQQPEEAQVFLLRTSVLDRLTGSLCEALTGQTGSHERLHSLEQANLFLIPLDEQRQWYRYHHLFAEFLLARARTALGDAEIGALHKRAAEWYEQHDFAAEAIEHAFLAADFDFAARLIERTADEWYARGALATLQRWLATLPENVLSARPRSAIYYAWALYFNGLGNQDGSALFERAEGYLRMAERSLEGISEANEERGMIFAVRTSMASAAPTAKSPLCATRDLARTIQCGLKALELLPEYNLSWRCVVNLGLGFAYRLVGDISAATQCFVEAARLGELGGNLSGALVALNNCGALLSAQGRLYEVERVYRDGLRIASQRNGDLLPITGQIYYGLGRLLYEWNRLSEAAQCMNNARTRCEAGGFPRAEVMMTLARVQFAQRNDEAVRETISRATEIYSTEGISATSMGHAEMERARLSLLQGNVAAAARWAKTADLEPNQSAAPWREAEFLTLARVLIAQGRSEKALELLDSLKQAAASGKRNGNLIEILTVMATALVTTEQTDDARNCLKQALVLAEPSDYVRVFTDEGEPLAGLLYSLYQQLKKERGNSYGFSREYVERLLLALRSEETAARSGPVRSGPARSGSESSESSEPATELVEPLSDRELEILRMIAAGRANQEIAEKLFVAPSTIKWHINNIYGKLGVRSRTQAIARARHLRLF